MADRKNKAQLYRQPGREWGDSLFLTSLVYQKIRKM